PTSYHFSILLSSCPTGSTLFPYTTLFRSRLLPPALLLVLPEVLTPESLARACAAVTSTKIPAVTRTALNRMDFLPVERRTAARLDRKSTRLNSSHGSISYAVFCLKKTNNN